MNECVIRIEIIVRKIQSVFFPRIRIKCAVFDVIVQNWPFSVVSIQNEKE